MGEAQFEKVEKGLDYCTKRPPYTCEGGRMCPYHDEAICVMELRRDALALIRQQRERINAQDEVIQALRKVGYPHDFQREKPWIVNYMCAITDAIKKAVQLE